MYIKLESNIKLCTKEKKIVKKKKQKKNRSIFGYTFFIHHFKAK